MSKTIVFLIISLVILIGLVLLLFVQSLESVAVPVKNNRVDEVLKIRFVSSWARYDGLSFILKRFNNNHKKIQIIDDSLAGKDFLTKLKTDFASGNDPDVFALWPGSDIDNLITKKKVANLTSSLNTHFRDFSRLIKKETWNMVKKGNQHYSLPLEIICEGLFVNRKLFDQYNIKVPTNYQELLYAVRRFREIGITPISYSNTPEGSFLYQNIVMKLGGMEVVENPFVNNRIHPVFLKAVTYMKELFENGAFPSNFYIMDDIARDNLFLEQKAAMIVQGSWFIYFVEKNKFKEYFEFHPFPSFDKSEAGSSIIYGLGSGNFHISQKAWDNSEKRRAALELLDTLMSQESISILSKNSGFFSSIDSRITNESDLRAQALAMINNARQLIPPVDNSINRNIWEEVIVPSLSMALANQISAEEIFKGLQGDDR